LILEDENSISPMLENNPVRFVAGIKFYLFGGEIEDVRLFRFNKHRFSFAISASIPQPIENFYLGVGYDLIPGVNLNAGVHLYQNTAYTIENGAITERSIFYKYAGYVGLGLDASLFTNLIQFIF